MALCPDTRFLPTSTVLTFAPPVRAVSIPKKSGGSRNRRDKTIKLWDATSGALTGASSLTQVLVSGVLARQHPDMSLGTDNTSGRVSYARKLCNSSKCAVPKKPDTS